MESDAAVKECLTVGKLLDDVRVQLLAAGDIEWTGQAGRAYSAMLDESLHSLGRLRGSADAALHAALRHAVAARRCGGAST